MSKKTRNILITGANGFVGRVLTEKLLKTDNNPFLVSRDKKYECPGARILYGDLTDEKFCQKIVKDIDLVYYLAGYKKNIAFHTKYSNDFVLGNVEPLIYFLKAARNSSVKEIIYLSSTNIGFYKEGEEDGYVVGKYINELILKSFAKQYQIDIKIARSVGIYGPGDNFNPETANFIPSMINKVYAGGSELSVWGNGKREMQFIFVEDLVKNLLEISKNDKSDFFVIGNPEILTVNEIAYKIIELSGKKMQIKNDITKADKPSQLFDFSNVIDPKISFDEGLSKTIEYYKEIYV